MNSAADRVDEDPNKVEEDPFLDTPVRFLGYVGRQLKSLYASTFTARSLGKISTEASSATKVAKSIGKVSQEASQAAKAAKSIGNVSLEASQTAKVVKSIGNVSREVSQATKVAKSIGNVSREASQAAKIAKSVGKMSQEASQAGKVAKSIGNISFEAAQAAKISAVGVSKNVGKIQKIEKYAKFVPKTKEMSEAVEPSVEKNKFNKFLLRFGSAIAYSYIFGDVYYSSIKAEEENKNPFRAVIFTSIFHAFGTLLIPGIIIHKAVHTAESWNERSLLSQPTSPTVSLLRRWRPTFAGLMCMPLLPVLVDKPVEHSLEKCFDIVWPEH